MIDLYDALATLEEMRALDVDEGVANALFRVGVAYLQRGKLDEAAEALDEAYYLCKKLENHEGRAEVCIKLAEVAAQRGEGAKALEWVEEAAEVFGKGAPADKLRRLTEARAGALEAAGKFLEAAECWQQLLKEAREVGDEVSELLILQRLASALRQAGRLEEALKAYEAMTAVAHRLNEPSRVALGLVGTGSCLGGLGRIDEAVQALTQAREQFEALGQRRWAREVEREITRLTKEEDK